MDSELNQLLSDADRNLGRLDGVTTVLPNPDLFVAMYVRQEAVLSSQIEGTQSTLEDILQFEIGVGGVERPKDIGEVVNYVRALNHGLERLKEFPLSLRLVREIHAELLKGVRGARRTPGEFRQTQNWIGPEGCTLETAAFVPPPVHEMHQALDNLEKFLHGSEDLPPLIHCGLAHAQFETIHPFLDGNGRVGRLLITFLLCHRRILHKPLLYLSHYFKQHRAQYYDRLNAIRTDDDWEGWLKFFLRGVAEVSREAVDTARAILDLREQHRQLISQNLSHAAYAHALLDSLFQSPLVNVRFAQSLLKCSYDTANKLVSRMVQLGMLVETTGQRRNRRFRYEPCLALFPASRAIKTTEPESESKNKQTAERKNPEA